MAWKNLKQRSLADALIVEHAALTELDDAHALLDWSKLEAHLVCIHNKATGEKAWPPLMMFKALLLQSWHTLSDPQLEKQSWLAPASDKRSFVSGMGLKFTKANNKRGKIVVKS